MAINDSASYLRSSLQQVRALIFDWRIDQDEGRCGRRSDRPVTLRDLPTQITREMLAAW